MSIFTYSECSEFDDEFDESVFNNEARSARSNSNGNGNAPVSVSSSSNQHRSCLRGFIGIGSNHSSSRQTKADLDRDLSGSRSGSWSQFQSSSQSQTKSQYPTQLYGYPEYLKSESFITAKTESTFSGIHNTNHLNHNQSSSSCSRNHHHRNDICDINSNSSSFSYDGSSMRKKINCLHAANDRLSRRTNYMNNGSSNHNHNGYKTNNCHYIYGSKKDHSHNNIYKHSSSLAGLLESGDGSEIADHMNFHSNGDIDTYTDVAINFQNGLDAQTYKTTKTLASSSFSVASSSHRSRTSRTSRRSANNSGGGESSKMSNKLMSYESFDFMEVDDIKRKSLGKTLIGNCMVGLKNNKLLKQEEEGRSIYHTRSQILGQARPVFSSLSPSTPPRNTKSTPFLEDGANNNKHERKEEPLFLSSFPATSDTKNNGTSTQSPQFFKFHNALPSHKVENCEFPQIIFADDVNSDHYNNKDVHVNHFESSSFNNNNHYHQNGNRDYESSRQIFNGSHNDIISRHNTQQQRYQHPQYPPCDEEKIHSFFHPDATIHNKTTGSKIQRYTTPRNASSPKGSAVNSHHSRNNNASPTKSVHSFKEEGQFLDTLANALTAYNSFKTGTRAFVNTLMEEVDMNTPHIPDVVDVVFKHQDDSGSSYGFIGGSGDYSDDVSDVGMASTSEGRRFNEDFDEHGQMQLRTFDSHKEQRRPAVRRKSNDYFDASIKERNNRISNTAKGTSYNNHNVNMKGVRQVDERSQKWRLREADRQNSNLSNRTFQQHQLASREFMETGVSLIDRDVSGSSDEIKIQSIPPPRSTHNNNNHVDEEEVDPTFAFGGSGVRKPPLALSEAFEEFGIDDRIYSSQHRPGDTFDVEESSEQYFERGFNNLYHSGHTNTNGTKRNTTTQLNFHANDNDDSGLTNTNGTKRNTTTQLNFHANDNDDKERRKSLMNSYISNHHFLQECQEHDTHAMKQQKMKEVTKAGAMNTPSNDYGNTSSPATISTSKRSLGRRSSKYREVNGSAYFPESSSTISMQTSKWANTAKKTVNEGTMLRGAMTTTESEQEDNHDIKGTHRFSPQSVADHDGW